METNQSEVQLQEEGLPEARPDWPRVHVLVTALVGLVMLLVGAAAGYLGRPLVAPQPTPTLAAASAERADASSDKGGDPAAGNPSAAELMAAVVAQTRHFKGDVSAPVTIVEFGDFQ